MPVYAKMAMCEIYAAIAYLHKTDMPSSSLRCWGMARVNEVSHSFTFHSHIHKWNEPRSRWLNLALVFGRTVCKTVRPMLSDHCLSCPVCLSVCNDGVLWPNGWMDQDETSHAGRPRPRWHCDRWDPDPQKGGTAPNFRPMSIVAKRLDGSRRHLVWR